MTTQSPAAQASVEHAARYSLQVPGDERLRLAVGWLMLALASLVASGIFSLLLVLSRTPYVKDLFPLVDFFHVALVVHVDLSVLVWFLAFAGMLWSINSTTRVIGMGWLALGLAACGTLVMCLAPFLGGGAPIMANYIPVIDDPLFLGGLAIFGLGFAALVLRSLAAVPLIGLRPRGIGALRFGLNCSAISAAVALLAFIASWQALPEHLDRRAYFELLFWGGGHVIQFTYTLMMFVCWLWMAEAIHVRLPLSPRVAILLFAIGLVAVFLTPVIYLAWEVGSVEHHRMLTWLMQVGGGLAIVPFALAITVGIARSWRSISFGDPRAAALIASLLLFGAGGVIGLMIHGSNVKIPAHYHGCIVGVTLALMGLTYHLLPLMGFAMPQRRLAWWQSWIYGGGQLLHIAGLLWGGGYGVQRKVAGAQQVLRSAEEVAAMGLMGLGGLIAVVGGLLFLVVVWRATRQRPSGAATTPTVTTARP